VHGVFVKSVVTAVLVIMPRP